MTAPPLAASPRRATDEAFAASVRKCPEGSHRIPSAWRRARFLRTALAPRACHHSPSPNDSRVPWWCDAPCS